MSEISAVGAADAVRTVRSPRVLAFFLPQFHPIPENDEAWGKGFTEWTNVTRSVPRFKGHYQPHLPADLGLYDLRLPEVRQAQAELAKASGVNGFVYYHYWFNGRRLLERPVEDMRKSGNPDFPFALCWANEGWTRRWDGGSEEVIVEQRYSPADDLAHWRWLLDVFADRRYITVEGRPLFLIYRTSLLPDARRTTERWRQESVRLGMPDPYLVRVETTGEPKVDPAVFGCDAAVQFQPDFDRMWVPSWRTQVWRTGRRIIGKSADRRVPYSRLLTMGTSDVSTTYVRFPGVCPSWDNSPRAKRGALIVTGSSPDLFEEWVFRALSGSPLRDDTDLMFVNAWNEWAEGAHLEPDQRYGDAWMQALRRGLDRASSISLDDSGRRPVRNGLVGESEPR